MLVREVPWPDGVRVLMIERAGEHVIPTGDTRICATDELLFVSRSGSLDDARLKLALMCEQRVRPS